MEHFISLCIDDTAYGEYATRPTILRGTITDTDTYNVVSQILCG